VTVVLSVIDVRNLATAAHDGQTRWDGTPYINHPKRVAARVAADHRLTEAERLVGVQAAYLHDVVEDTDITLADLLDKGVRPDVVEVVDLLTRRKPDGETHADYVGRILASGNRTAIIVKLADIADNSRTEAVPADREAEAASLRKRSSRYVTWLEAAL
jgi:(p)ppGpp synthase/HD superfamily hydrolase